jgi:hypothetical protein
MRPLRRVRADGWNPCHTALPQCGKGYTGDAARRAIARRLVGKAESQAFAAQICDFYGNALWFKESRVLPASFFEVSLSRNPLSLRYALVRLQLGTARTTESLSHELLHLGLAVSGYPLPASGFMPPELAPYARHLIAIQAIAHNLLQHELIFGGFCCLGFEATQFLADLPAPPGYEQIAAMSRAVKRAEAVEFSWWSLEHFRQWLSARHGIGRAASVNAERALYWGSKVYPALQESTREIRATIESGALSDRERYPLCVNTVFRLMGLPEYCQWVILTPDSNGNPCALGWNPRGKGVP